MATYVTGRMVQDQSIDSNDLTQQAAIPPGAVMSFAMSAAPVGWLPCDGAAINRTTYSALFTVVRTIHGVGDGSNTFNVPDLRGEFIRGWDNGRAVDSGRTFGTFQEGTYVRTVMNEWLGNDGTGPGGGIGQGFANADEVYANSYNSGVGAPPGARTAINTAWSSFLDDNGMSAYQYITNIQGPNDTYIKWIKHRPRNVALLYCIKF